MLKIYEPLHHKYRPKRFDELIGQEPIISTLKQAIITKRISPAYIFSGPRGTGKTSSARIFAKSLNCLKSEEATIDPCGQCELCLGINSGNALDIIEIDAASNTGVENIRELIDRSRFAPAKARWKVYVIDECHMLSTAAFNALLKTLEEPPPKVVFVLATTDPQRVLPTILSRCMRFDFRRISLNDLVNHLKNIANKEAIQINEEAIFLIAKHSQGGLRDAESLLDQVSLLPPPITPSTVLNLIGGIPEEELIKLAKSLINKDASSILNICNGLINNGKEPIGILQGIASILRDLVITKVSNNQSSLCNVTQENNLILKDLSDSFQLNEILELQSKLQGSENNIRNSSQPKLWLEIQLLGMISGHNSQLNTNKTIAKKNIKNVELINQIKQTTQEESLPKQERFLGDVKQKNIQSTQTNNLDDVWQKVIAMLELPSTKMLLSQQAKLFSLSSNSAEIAIPEKWISMIESRKNLIEDAFNKSMGRAIRINLIQQKEKLSNEVKGKKIIQTPIEKKEVRSNENDQNTLRIDKQVQPTRNLDSKSIDNQAKQFADFFNGEVVNLE
tara:strand:+ start:1426 stop:3114 length:1689 start_codon:yes stop_codon:yes gene_type:complete